MSDGQHRQGDQTREAVTKPRKQYVPPALLVYGDIRVVTRNANPMGAVSDGTGMFAKTT